MSTLSQLVDEVISNLHGYVRDQEESTHLTIDATAADVSLTLASGAKVPGSGRFEIEDELIWVDAVDTTNNTVSVPPYGRGFDSTTAAAHTAGKRVICNPLFPRNVVRRAINDTIQDAAGELFAVGTYQFPYTAAKLAYTLPAAVNQVLWVSWQETGPSAVWRPVRTWRLDQAYGTTGAAAAVVIGDPITPGRTVNVVYTKFPTTLVNNADDFTVSGLPSTAQDVIVYGACARLLSYVDASRVNTQSIESGAFTQGIPVGSAMNVSKQMYAMFRQRLQEERLRLLATFPTQVHYSR